MEKAPTTLTRICVYYPKSNPYYQGRQLKMHLFSRIMRLFRLRHFICFQAPYIRELAPACDALVLYVEAFECSTTSDWVNHNI